MSVVISNMEKTPTPCKVENKKQSEQNKKQNTENKTKISSSSIDYFRYILRCLFSHPRDTCKMRNVRLCLVIPSTINQSISLAAVLLPPCSDSTLSAQK